MVLLIAISCRALNVEISLYTNAGMFCPLMKNDASKVRKIYSFLLQ